MRTTFRIATGASLLALALAGCQTTGAKDEPPAQGGGGGGGGGPNLAAAQNANGNSYLRLDRQDHKANTRTTLNYSDADGTALAVVLSADKNTLYYDAKEKLEKVTAPDEFQIKPSAALTKQGNAFSFSVGPYESTNTYYGNNAANPKGTAADPFEGVYLANKVSGFTPQHALVGRMDSGYNENADVFHQLSGHFHAGPVTQGALSGQASYEGGAMGYFKEDGAGGTLAAGFKMDADFGAGTFNSQFSNIQTNQPGSAFNGANAAFTGAIQGSHFASTSGGIKDAGGADFTIRAGTVSGSFYGPNGAEAAGVIAADGTTPGGKVMEIDAMFAGGRK